MYRFRCSYHKESFRTFDVARFCAKAKSVILHVVFRRKATHIHCIHEIPFVSYFYFYFADLQIKKQKITSHLGAAILNIA